jgi:hypothetical protein
MTDDKKDVMVAMQALMGRLSDMARDRGTEQGAALSLFLQRALADAADALDIAESILGEEDLAREAARRVVYNFTLGLLQSLEDTDHIDQVGAVMAAQQAIDEVDADGVSLEYRDVPYAIPLDGDEDAEERLDSEESLEDEFRGMRLRAAESGVSVRGYLLNVACVVSPTGQWSIGFETPDAYCGAVEQLDGEPSEVMAAMYRRWFVDHFLTIVWCCTAEMRDRTGDGSVVPGVFSRPAFELARSARGESEDQEETAVKPIDLGDCYIEASQHVLDASDRKPVSSHFYKVTLDDQAFCGILELHTADGRITEQLNLFPLPKVEPGCEELENMALLEDMALRLESQATMLAAERRAPITLRRDIALTMCEGHRMMMAPIVDSDAQTAQPPAHGSLH